MKVLLSAIACHPHRGSEAHVGWQAMINVAQQHKVWVLTHVDSREGIEAAQLENQIPSNICFHYLGNPSICHPNRLIARLQSWLEFYSWNKSALKIARKLHADIRFDLVHHVTYATWRIPSPLWRLDAPFIWGPVGGVARFPWHFLPILSPQAQALEIARNLANAINARSAELALCLKNTTAVIASNQESFDFFAHIRGHTQGLHLLSAASFSDEKIKTLSTFSSEDKQGTILRLFAGGNMIGSKGVGLALTVLAELKKTATPFHYTVAGRGPETPHLEKLAKRLGLENEVTFSDGFRGEDYVRQLKQSHLFFMPSFRENAPVTILEAMLAGCIPCVVNASAQGEIVKRCGTGLAASIRSIEEARIDLLNFLIKCNAERENLFRDGQTCSAFVSSNYNSRKYEEALESIFNESLTSKP